MAWIFRSPTAAVWRAKPWTFTVWLGSLIATAAGNGFAPELDWLWLGGVVAVSVVLHCVHQSMIEKYQTDRDAQEPRGGTPAEYAFAFCED